MKLLNKGYVWRQTAAAVLSLTLVLPAALPADAATLVIGGSPAERAKEVLEKLESQHVSAPQAQKLSDAAIQAMIESLGDPYTQYFTPEQLTEFENSVANRYVGIGVRVSQQPDGVYIAQVFDGPAQQAGIQTGDVIVKVGDQSVVGAPLSEATSRIMGEPGTEVTLQLIRDGVTIEKTVKRQQIQVPVVTGQRYDGGVVYIRVTSFSSDADEQVSVMLDFFKSQGEIKSLIVDLRDNPGGLLDTAKEMARLFVKEGTLIHTKNRNGLDEPVTFSGGTTQSFPVFMMVNGSSASASEVLTGALQDYKAATAIGTKTYGKGSVQNVIPLDHGGALKVTVEEYLTPNQRKVNAVGLEPDIAVEGGATPELLTALRTAGVGSISLELKRINLSVNGHPVEDSFRILRENGLTYVPARVLAAVLGAKVEWNAAASSVQLLSADGSVVYTPEGAGGKLRDGTMYISLAQAAEAFKTLKWSDDGQILKLGR
ncbi:S41 family peptidase [Paenibacillus puerhi]|uniref:S41 family peptidase n=1 Tax=Paenibacillus puerhi TaxID=2692622 RepID=UPI00135C25E8|nr:S41 family peptidase [Paenibacillus puerhi]